MGSGTASQVKAQKRLNDENPHLLILGPMCALSRLQHTKTDELAELLEQGERQLEFACILEMQIE